LRTCFVYHDGPAHHIFSIEGGDGLLEFRVIGNFHEPEATGLAGRPIANYGNRLGRHTHILELCPQFLFRCPERKVSYVQFFHRASPSLFEDFVQYFRIATRPKHDRSLTSMKLAPASRKRQ
jgi:hypothetical protein